ncbi:DUF1501 domain-containing protein [Halomonas sp. V046]|uniref:DUF1501 domain-containing protein n=1 Tax=Halomonas sp. V046 TaxID=3459611 RepID=UPI004043ADDD
MLNRRQFLARLGASASLLLWPPLALLAAEGQPPRPQRLAVVLLRGALDGLAAVPAYAEPTFAALRGELDLSGSGGTGLLKLDGTFALHPALASCHRLFSDGDFAVVHACGLPYEGRSHFDAQECLENGSDSPTGSRTGWLNRAVGAMQGSQGLGIASSRPLIIRGDAPFSTWSPTPGRQSPAALANRVAELYARDPALGAAFARAVAAQQVVPGDLAGGGQLDDVMAAAGEFLADAQGPQVALVQDDGWDTHAQQNAVLSRKLEQLDSGMRRLRETLAPRWRDTAVIVVTEFGRTVRINGTRGTDHGTASTVLLAGGAIRGGKVHGEWPGLARLKDGRDLVTTRDVRSVLKGVLRDHMHIDEGALGDHVFPRSRGVAALDGLIA